MFGRFNVFLALSFVALFSGNAFAYGDEAGLKGGLNFSSFSKTSSSVIVGANVGFLRQFRINKHFRVKSEAIFSFEGARVDYGEGKKNLRLGWFNCPIMLVYNVKRKGLDIEVGPQVGMLFSARYNGKSRLFNRSVYDLYHPINISVNVGVNYPLTEDVHLGLRYNYGLFNVSQFAVKYTEAYQHTLQLSIAYVY